MTDSNKYRFSRAHNLHIVDAEDCDEHGMPVITGSNSVPEELVAFTDAANHKGRACVHFFLDDYRFERVWSCPEKYAGVLTRMGSACTPDFSTYTDMPKPLKAYNVYRSRALGAYFERLGLDVYPTLQWAEDDDMPWMLAGLPEGVTAACSTRGCAASKSSRARFSEQFAKALDIVKPSHVVMYGKSDFVDFRGVPHTCFEARSNNGR